jgi:hypothetical protein
MLDCVAGFVCFEAYVPVVGYLEHGGSDSMKGGIFGQLRDCWVLKVHVLHEVCSQQML